MTPTFPPILAADHEELIEFLVSEEWPYHGTVRISVAEAKEAVAAGRYSPDASDAPHWVEVRGERVGLLVLRELDDPTPVFDLRLRHAWRGRGLGRLALAWLASEAFTRHGKHRIEGHTRADNVPMRRVFEASSGWVLEARYRQAWPDAAGEWHDAVAYALLATDWRTGGVTPLPE